MNDILNHQRKIADEQEKRLQRATNVAKSLVKDMTITTREELELEGLFTQEMRELFERAKKHFPPTGFKRYFCYQTEKDRQTLRELQDKLLALVILERMALTVPSPVAAPHVALRKEAAISTMKSNTLSQRAEADRIARQQRDDEEQQRRRRREQEDADAYARRRRQDDDDASNMILQTSIWNSINSQNSTRATTPVITSGGGGNFDGGGASGRWDAPTPESPQSSNPTVENTSTFADASSNDMGASSFS